MKIGTDIVQIGRIEASMDRHGQKFLDRFLSRDEQDRLNTKAESIAGYWAAKEAIAKALGCGIGEELRFHDISIYKDAKGMPYFELDGSIKKMFKIDKGSLSISHDGGFAVAVALVI